MRILVKVDAYHKGEPTKAGTVIEVDDVDAVRWIKEQVGIEWRPTRIYPSRDLGKILGVSPLDLKLPKEWYVTVQHLHVGNSSRRMRKGSQFATWAIVRRLDDHKVIGEYTAIPRKGDRPSRATGVQVAVGRAIVLAFSDATSWTVAELLKNRVTWRRFSDEAKAFMCEPANENTRPVFSKQKEGDHKTVEGLRELFAEGPLGQRHDIGIDGGVAYNRLPWSDLTLQQAHQAKDLLYRKSNGIAPSIKECACHDYMIKNHKVVGTLSKVDSGHPTDTDQVYVVEWMTWDEIKEAKNKDLKSHVLHYLKRHGHDVTKPRMFKYGINDGTVRSIQESLTYTQVRESTESPL